ncbi:MAG: hypothetical protein JSV44_00165 [Candidatus Zixiibacteriota bacterium]|nr:MAG: hypothetical protein JSV44_00165 [candidate division Zixibacteria bacterium]
MACDKLEKSLRLRLGKLTEAADTGRQFSDPATVQLHSELVKLEKKLRLAAVEPLSDEESRRLVDSLNDKINRYQSRALRFYRFGVRYGISLAALLLMIGISYFVRMHPVAVTYNVPEYITVVYQSDLESISEDIIASEYVNTVVNSSLWEYGYDSAEILLGELDAEELEHAENTLEIGDIL